MKTTYYIKKIARSAIYFLLFIFNFSLVSAQSVGINATGAAPAPSAMLDLNSTTLGVLVPRMTTAQMNTIVAPAVSLLIYNTTVNCFEWWTGAVWQVYTCTCNGPPASPGPITGPASVCSGALGATYTIAAVPSATSYSWTVPSGATITAGQGTTSITVNWGATSGNVCVTAINSCGGSAPTCLAVTVVTPPVAPGPISGPLTICATNAGYVYSVPFTVGCTYTWTVAPAAGTITSGQGTATITVTAAPGAGSGSICVTATNACGTSAATCIVVTVLAGTAPITLDNTVNANGASTVNITTANPNEMILIAADGWPGTFTGSCTVDGNPATLEVVAETGNSGVAAAFAYMAPLAGIHTIAVTETGYSSPYYLNLAAAFTGGCQLSLSKLVVSHNDSAGNLPANPIATTVNTVTPNNMLWVTGEANTGSAGTVLVSGAITVNDQVYALCCGINVDEGHNAAPTVGAYRVKCTDANLNGGGGMAIILIAIEP
jgi:hypothetical protein